MAMSLVVMAVAPLLLLSSLAGAELNPGEAIGMPNCDIDCGHMKVPYPFGMGPARCYWPGFKLTCNRTGKSKTPRLLLGDGTGTLGQVEDLYLRSPFLSVTRTGSVEIDAAGKGALGSSVGEDGPYTLASRANELTLTGCNVQVTLKNGNITMASCSSVCESYGLTTTTPEILTRDSLPCSGSRCCQVDIINQIMARGKDRLVYAASYNVEVTHFGLNRSSDESRVPTRVFVARKGWFEQVWLATDHPDRPNRTPSEDATLRVPIWLEWEVLGDSIEPADRNRTAVQCPAEADRRICKSNNSTCSRATVGYTCFCDDGFEGNPYVTDGCKDRCYYGDLIDTANCTCPLGTQGDPYQRGGCIGLITGGCRHICGNVSAPYPFGVGQGHDCYQEGFNLTCIDTGHEPARLFLDSDMVTQVLEISIRNNTVRVLDTGVVSTNISRPTEGNTDEFEGSFELSTYGHEELPYSLSTHNELILTGCNLMAELSWESDGGIVSVCGSFCSYNDIKQDDQCNGMGCCRTRISMYNNSMRSQFKYKLKWFNKGDTAPDREKSAPIHILIAEEGRFNQGQISSKLPSEPVNIPILLQWEVLRGFSTASVVKSSRSDCPREVSDRLCRSKHSYCKRGSRGGYTCHCRTGYDGEPDANPYVSDGCKGHNLSTTGKYIIIGVGIGAGVILSLFAASSISKKLKDRRAQILKRQFFENNRGQLLRQLVSQRADIAERMIITLEEIEKATNNFDKARELGGGGHGTVYKGILSDLHVVAIKKPKMVVQKEIDEFINEVAILSQINHRNVVKLYGCCLETEVPLLVYEFISNGTLYEHLHTGESRSLSWDGRLRIAVETAKSLAYLHSTASVPVIHRDVKSVNILLDDTLTAKVADFGASRYVPMDRSGVTTMVQGTIGYLDPMYFYTQRLTEKSDVYSFGVILVELLTRKKPSSYMSPEGDGLVAQFATLFAEGNLSEILDPQVVDEGSKEVEAVATLAVTCVKLRGEDRPTMRQVELTLEAVRASNQDGLASTGDEKFEENVIALNCPQADDAMSTEESTRQVSMEEELLLSSRYPR
ncbi:wall-associated receptor kinase 3 isoform X2 [Brachypodium distachyon]|uniref:Protein kinase domain-containing protein n=1 Tax=Brachypodium distachyon TaxID=15368 RepID=I1HMN4_BRADI|nr:wall-associated receptor kinase 3 isoform X2 [Brachypodium distachyon]KQK07898.1 hypothetical protein BRADI_2g38280v3 [Brachypodium distachyon]|eukprot:XP_010231814.2 wall-associated receptor kinase 3 isoform X2 [Brachypodium distachyon]